MGSDLRKTLLIAKGVLDVARRKAAPGVPPPSSSLNRISGYITRTARVLATDNLDPLSARSVGIRSCGLAIVIGPVQKASLAFVLALAALGPASAQVTGRATALGSDTLAVNSQVFQRVRGSGAGAPDRPTIRCPLNSGPPIRRDRCVHRGQWRGCCRCHRRGTLL